MSQRLSQQCSIPASEKPPRGFVDIPGYEGIYAINRDGSVYNCPRPTGRKGMFMKSRLLSGYKYVGLVNTSGKQKAKGIHRLLAETFLFNPDPRKYIEVNHIDGNKFNNSLENLEWCTSSENKKHAFAMGLSYIPEKTRRRWAESGLRNAMAMRKPVLQLSEDGQVLNRFNSIYEAGILLNLNHRTISEVARGKRIHHGGFKWRYEYQVH
jgi:hypothetical protein